jgi:hypothetical protein
MITFLPHRRQTGVGSSVGDGGTTEGGVLTNEIDAAAA